MRLVLYIVLSIIVLVVLVFGGAWIYISQIYAVPEARNLLVPSETMDQVSIDRIYDLSKNFENNTEISIVILDGTSVSYYGVERKSDSLLVVENKDRVYEIGSITKVMTAHILTALSGEGVVDMETSIMDYLPIENDRLRDVKLKHLVNHTSGLARMPDNIGYALNDPYAKYGREELYDYLKTIDDQLEIGETSSYSNLGFGILGHIMELSSGISLEALYQRYIFEPLEMKNSSADLAQVTNIVTPGDGMMETKGNHWNFDVLAGAGAAKSSVSQMGNYVQFLMEDNPISTMMRMPTFVDEKQTIGRALVINKAKEGGSIFWHNGGTGGFRSCMAFYPNSKKGVVVLSNLNISDKNKDNIDKICFLLLKSIMS